MIKGIVNGRESDMNPYPPTLKQILEKERKQNQELHARTKEHSRMMAEM